MTPPRSTARGRLRLPRRLEDDSPDPQGIHSASPDPRGLGSASPNARGPALPYPTTDDGSRLTRYSEAGSVSPDKPCPANPHDDGYRVRQDVRVNHSVRRHALHPYKEVLSGCDRTSAGTSPQAWQSLNSVAGACSPPYSIIGAALSLRTKDPTRTYDNHDVPRANQQSPRRPTPTGSGLDNPIRPAARGGGMGRPTC